MTVGIPRPRRASRVEGGVGLVREKGIGAFAGPAPRGHRDLVQQRDQLRVVTGLATGQAHRQRPTGTVDGHVHLGRESTA